MTLSRCRLVLSHTLRGLGALSALLFFAGCMNDREHGGGSETTVAGVTGKVLDATGNPVSGAAIRIRPEGALPYALLGVGSGGEDDTPLALSKADGSFLIRDIAPGAYWVECRGQFSGAALIVTEVTSADTLVRLPDAILRPTGAIRGMVKSPPDSMGLEMIAAYVYIPGLAERILTNFKDSATKDTMEFVLGNLPVGTFLVRVQPPFPRELSRLRILEIPDVDVRSGDTLDLGLLAFPLRANISDSAHSRDSIGVQAILNANASTEMVSTNSAVTGNRITMLYDFNGRITRIPREIAVLDRLDLLQLMGVGAPVSLEVDPEIAKLRGLKSLLLRNYTLDGLPFWALSFRELANLRLSAAGLSVFPEKVVDYPFLVALDLTDNKIPAIPPVIRKMQRLAVVDMSGNELTALPSELMDMESLMGFRVRKNRLCSLTSEWKAWVARQDSLWIRQTDPLSYWIPGVDSGWEASQRCGVAP